MTGPPWGQDTPMEGWEAGALPALLRMWRRAGTEIDESEGVAGG